MSLPNELSHTAAEVEHSELLYNALEIKERVVSLAGEITRHYGDKQIVVLSMLTGSVFFMVDLVRCLTHERLTLVPVVNYKTHGIKLPKEITNLIDKHVLILDDIADGGGTLTTVSEHVLLSKPASIKTCVLFDRPQFRTTHLEVDFVGFKTDHEHYLFGYGLDLAEKFRTLPDVWGVIKRV